jgi:hypothetical protein
MTRIHLTLIAGLLVLGACEKKPQDTTPPDTTAGTPDVKPVELDTSVPQEPDPPELAQGAQQYLLGQYADVVTLLSPIYADLKERQQYRASAIAGAWLALAHAKQVYENSKEPAEYALSMAQATEDPEVDAAAGLAMAAYQIGHEEYAPAIASLKDALAAKDSVNATLANVLHAEALIGAAFGGADAESVQDPAKFDEAKAAYDVAATKAKGSPSEDLLMGRVEEGYAALADYKSDKPGSCPHAIAAIGAFQRAGARGLLEGPAGIARKNKCALPADLATAEDA